MKERLQKIISQAGVTSRRKAELMILAGAVKVNGQVITELGAKFDLSADKIMLAGHQIAAPAPKTYFLLNKPKGYISTAKDERGRKTVLDLLPRATGRIYPLGRLDADTEGLLILTNDGALMHALLHPSTEVWKTYSVRVTPAITNRHLQELSEGVELEDGVTAPATVCLVYKNKDNARLELTIHEGRNRQVRRMLAALGYEVKSLKRIEFAGLKLTGLKRGEWRQLTADEVCNLYAKAKLQPVNQRGIKPDGAKKQYGAGQTAKPANYNEGRYGQKQDYRRGRRGSGHDGGNYGGQTRSQRDLAGKNVATGQKNAHHRQRPLQSHQQRRRR